MELTRRSVLAGLGAGFAQLLLARRLHALAPAGADQHASAGAAPAGDLDLMLTALSPGTLRISIAPADGPVRLHELGVIDRAEPAPLYPLARAQSQSVPWGKYTVTVSEPPLHISVSEQGKLRQEIRFAPDSTNVHFNLDGPVFGLGEGVSTWDLRGTRVSMSNGEGVPSLDIFGARMPVPWVVSPSGWGIFVGRPQGFFAFTQTEGTFSAIEATSTRNVYLILGDAPADLLREHADLTGHPHLPPLWSFGYQQSHRTLASEEEILSEAKTFRQKQLPCDAAIYLGTGFCPSGWNTGHGSFTFNEKIFPNPPATIRQLHEENLKVIVHIVPPGNFHGSVHDTGAAAREPGDAAAYWAQHLPLVKAGVDGWWPDEGDGLSVSARLERNAMYWEGSRMLAPAKRPFALHRNGYAGLQRYGWLWSGDTESTWDALKGQIMVGINTGACGIPYWGSDTGGFSPTLEYTPELYVRWFQFSSFCPSFRSHGRDWKLHLPWGWSLGDAGPKEATGAWTENWPPAADLHRTDVEEICRAFLNLRYQLLPYIYSTAAQAHATGMPMMRALWLQYPDDPRASLVEDSFLWGDNFLVAPICGKNATERKVYLPQGAWWDYWAQQQESLAGAKEIVAHAELNRIPLYVKAGSIVPMGPVKQYSGEKSKEPVVLKIYGGADGEFRWYDDDGESFRYEQGQYMLVHCEWQEGKKLLTLRRDRAGALGMGRPVRVELVATGATKTITLGEPASIVQF
jgi:alpha-glucosidase/alpha-D-xyloside xylohydrolase